MNMLHNHYYHYYYYQDCGYFPSRKASLPFGWYSFSCPTEGRGSGPAEIITRDLLDWEQTQDGEYAISGPVGSGEEFMSRDYRVDCLWHGDSYHWL